MKTLEQLLAEKIEENKKLIAQNEMYIKVLRSLEAEGKPQHQQPKRRVFLRRKTNIEQAAQIIKEAGRPLHANEILVKMGKKRTLRNKVSIASSMAHYSNAGKVFTRTAPNTFGILN